MVGNREMGTGISEASKRVPIFPGTQEANYKMVPICLVPISRLRTVRHLGMGTGISEASKRVPIFPFTTQGGKQVSSYF